MPSEAWPAPTSQDKLWSLNREPVACKCTEQTAGPEPQRDPDLQGKAPRFTLIFVRSRLSCSGPAVARLRLIHYASALNQAGWAAASCPPMLIKRPRGLFVWTPGGGAAGTGQQAAQLSSVPSPAGRCLGPRGTLEKPRPEPVVQLCPGVLTRPCRGGVASGRHGPPRPLPESPRSAQLRGNISLQPPLSPPPSFPLLPPSSPALLLTLNILVLPTSWESRHRRMGCDHLPPQTGDPGPAGVSS